VVSVGKRLTQDIYLAVEQGLAGADSFVQLSLLLGKKWKVTARSGGQESALDVYYTLKFDALPALGGTNAAAPAKPAAPAAFSSPAPARSARPPERASTRASASATDGPR
jgi:hypothetical protein